jgi:hypothetical protein
MDTRKNVVSLRGVCGVEEAEALLDWLQAHPKGRVNLQACEHLHTALLQVLLAARPPVSESPADVFLRDRVATLFAGAAGSAQESAPR